MDRRLYVLSNSISVIIGQFKGKKKKLSAGQRFTQVPGNIHTGAVLLVNTTFLNLVTVFIALLVVGTEMEW